MLNLLLIVVLAAHLLATNLATGGPLACLWLQWRERRHGEGEAVAAARRVATASLVALAVAVVLGGVAVGLIAVIRPEPFFRAAARLPMSRYWFGIAELAFYFGCLEIYRRLSRADAASGPRFFRTRLVLLLLAGSDLAYHFPPLLALIGVLGMSREQTAVRFTAAFGDPHVMALVVHYLLASLAVTGVCLTLVATRLVGEPLRRDLATTGGRWALLATLGQFGVGAWVLVSLPAAARDRLLGDDVWATLLLTASLLAVVMLLHTLASLALGEVQRRRAWMATAWLAIVVLMMVAAQDRARRPVYVRAASEYPGDSSPNR